MVDYVPELRTPVPGPNAKQIVEMDKQYISPSYTRGYPLVIERTAGMFLYDVDGNRFLDFTSGVAVNATGHCNPEVENAIIEQVKKFTHFAFPDFYYEIGARLAKKLCEITPGKHAKKVFFGNSGAEAVEAALKLARYATKRPRYVAFYGGFHGRTMGALSFTASKAVQREGFSPLVGDVTHIPYPNPYRCVFGTKNPNDCTRAVINYLENLIFKKHTPPKDVAAVIVEAVQGEGGYVVPPKNFFKELKKVLDKHGILLILDEVQSGFGRTGKWFACEHFDVVPDIICTAKPVGGGIPLGAMVARADLHVWPSGAHANTFGGNPVACAAGLKSIELIENGLMDNAAKMGKSLHSKLVGLARKHSCIGDVRGIGLMQAIEIVDREGRPDAATREKMVNGAFEKGLVILGCGESSIRFIPPLIVEEGHIKAAAAILDEVISAATGSQKKLQKSGYAKSSKVK